MKRVEIIFGFEKDFSNNRIRPETYAPALDSIQRGATDRFHGVTLNIGKGMTVDKDRTHYIAEQVATLVAFSDQSAAKTKEAANELAEAIAAGLRQSKVLVSITNCAEARFVKNPSVRFDS